MSTGATSKPNVVVIGGSYVGCRMVDLLAQQVHETHNVVLIEKNTHFRHLFAFPRISVVPGFTEQSCIPYTNAFHAAPPNSTSFVHAVATKILPDHVLLANGDSVLYDYLVLATGTGSPGALFSYTKPLVVDWFTALQKSVENAHDIAVIGGGAFGVQLALDIREYYPDKNVTLIHSRQQLMNRFHPELDRIATERLEKAQVKILRGSRVKLPESGLYPNDGSRFLVERQDGTTVEVDLALLCNGNVMLSAPMESLSPSSIDPDTKEIIVKSTMQIADDAYPHVFAVGDIARTGAVKAARPASVQAQIIADNIQTLISGKEEQLREYVPDPPAIHLSLGLRDSVKFRNPATPGGKPTIIFDQDGRLDMGCGRLWSMRAPGITDYKL
ncbi:FAD/NAD(P)-binding domain-containing protein [Fistulina hepatica ATCC 64428]|uniref:FAD/NAD(P)-binding domain-containing protein n=1 Tax=Fistulina hepatica ATCC 64428 TaxID=1128425 RepID=A0A0D7AFZ3_9AGAR|nr:FAD/NAD(P)-binding domain-containing protein [Fistulina hepatica ATCC 64428]